MATYRVTVGDKDYQVEVEDVNAQPVRAVVNGRVVHVWVASREPGTDPQGALPGPRSGALPDPVPVSGIGTGRGGIGTGRGVSGSAAPQPAQSAYYDPARAEPAAVPATASSPPRPVPPAADGERGIRAPMPGSIVSVAVQAGDRVEVGQDVCVLEAMKMNNRIRAPRAGAIAQVHVSPGQQVQHDDLLVTYAD